MQIAFGARFSQYIVFKDIPNANVLAIYNFLLSINDLSICIHRKIVINSSSLKLFHDSNRCKFLLLVWNFSLWEQELVVGFQLDEENRWKKG